MAKASSPLATVRTVAALRRAVLGWRRRRDTVALVPTMGALHAGHLALVARARRLADRVVVSLFVNPAQFGPNEDFARYPRDESADRAKLREAGADLLYAPGVGAIYPPGFATGVTVGALAERLDGIHRPGHFTGVATVVAKLLIEAQADFACFGEKDYQQLQIITRMVRDLDIPTRIVGVPTVRERDGLALSSRNAYLSPDDRAVAPVLHRVVLETGERIHDGMSIAEAEARGVSELTMAGFVGVDYLTVVDAETLEPLERLDRPGRILVAARLGTTRLIDNEALRPSSRAPAPGNTRPRSGTRRRAGSSR
ncbi:MAG TPA: pantoate--beta-alanine ligase [Stellaceae bacterium]|nr:pantoate--beta-alanine ligase [Stellaceae bacterium]